MTQRKQNSKTSILLLVGGGLLLIAVAIMLASQNTSTITTPAAISEEEADAAVPRVSLVEAKAAHDAGSAIFLDVRSAEAYQSEHITNSINIPLAELESRIAELDPEQWIITYCTWQDEHSSARAASILLENGFKNVTPILGGFEAWTNAEYPTEP